MLSSLGCLLLCGSVALALGNAQKLPKGKRPNLKVHINTTSDSILLKFLRPSPNVKLEGFLLGYGSNVSPNQYFPLPTEGKFTEAVVDAEPKYLIVVRPAPPPSQKKSCSGKSRPRKPLQLVVGTLTPSSVFLSWGFLINPHHDWTLPSHCPNDRFYTIRYREKDKEKKWIFQLCPATETIVENLKPNTVYEFGVKDNIEGGIWSKIFNHKTIVTSKNKINGKIQSTYDQVHTVPSYVPRKLIPITIIKQVIQNVTHRASTKSPDKIPFGGTILVHLIIPGLNDTTVKLPTSIMFEISDALKVQLAKNETLALPAESKTPEVEKLPEQPITVTPETVSRTTVSSTLDISETTLVFSEMTPEMPQTVLIPKFELPLSTLAPKRLPEFPEAKTPSPFERLGGTLASSEKPWMAPIVKTSEDSKAVQPQTATYDAFSSSTTSDETGIEPHTATSDPILDSVPPKTSRTLEQPKATPAPSKASFTPHKVEPFTSPETQPTTAAPQQTTSVPSTPKRRPRPKTPKIRPAPESQTLPASQSTKALNELQTLSLKPVTSPRLEMTQSQSVSDDRELVMFSTESSQETIAPAETDYVYPTTRELLRPEEPRTEVVESISHVSEFPETTLETSPLPSQTIILHRPAEPHTEPAPRQMPHIPPKLKTPRPRIPPTQRVPKGSRHTTSKPKLSPSPEVSDTVPAPKDELLSHKPDPEASHSELVLQPVTFRVEPPKTTTASLETSGSPFKPVISPHPGQEELQTTLAPHRLYTAPVRPRIPDKSHIRPVLNRTATRPIKPKPSRMPSGNGVGTGTKQAPKPSSTGRNVSVDTHTTRKPATIPGIRRPPMPPRPVPPQRKPLPPNNVTGKPGSAGIISSGRVTSSPLEAALTSTGAPSERPEIDKRPPTAPASGEELGSASNFSSSPTKETDHLGKPRFTGPHVRYIPKPDNSPCSITDSVKRFPTEEATEGNVTSPPQNPPTNLTVVTVEGCPSFVILDWEKPLNDTVTEYEVISRENGSFSGKNKSIQITNQTFSTVENLKPDTSYEFEVKPKNPLGEGPPSKTVAFNTESADPRVSEPISGKYLSSRGKLHTKLSKYRRT
ncbi:target of Nesh-SH3 isoform X5 [Nannospalax galili]|uniref:target of Nesh-SH3 isoform X5 n=1 Tax=Nannospalax galili TaxID=1026970 RepID=UPI00081A01B0|nr:target of Nesh-SH3 isoform X5 [Nannospalax galili]